jgi:alpha-ketoglutarate-dependent taurine dioxygenase
MTTSDIEVTFTPQSLRVRWPDGAQAEFASLWLRDNRSEDRDAHSGQRLVDIMDVPADPRIASAQVNAGAVQVNWEGEQAGARYALEWLAAQARPAAAARPELARRRWLEGAAKNAATDFAWAALDDARRDPALRLQWMIRLLQDGVAFFSGVPCTAGGILEAMQEVGQVSATNYGLVFDVRSVPQPENLAYSDLGLGLHTDNPYREPVPGFQSLHAVQTSAEGGDSLFADGIALAEHLRATDPAAFAVLTQTPVPFTYRSKEADLYAERPLIQLACDGAVAAVHYNNRSIAPLRLDAQAARRFYAAYRRFAALLREPRFQLKFRLRDGDLVMFDNQRILHGRTAFSSQRHPRYLRGCYLSRDSVYSAAGLLRRAHDASSAPAQEPRP